ncbi:MAG: ATP-binding cassette domain-containing protein [Phenylobacterium sp.]|uniref:ABC transporter ATP-binding protein n=1 Tax=Phenylobacterium sp. TaxID=1871053 RepID=UPI0025CE7C18|nr:ABC transporter ATP-binding protein [Phenylobacterium sp.]MBI1196915.1 ATP-binding cassette domain-containing protein [Phenylobacterium sp.]
MSGLLEVEGVSRRLADPQPVVLVRDVSLRVDRGEFVAIIGPSGCGKSSLLYLLGLLDRPTTGSVRIEGRATEALSETERTRLRLRHIGFVFQFHFLLPELTALANVALPMRRAGLDGREAEERARALLAKLGIEAEGGKRPDRMSGGQRQRVAIARALANDPALILGDEPTGNLDSANSARVVEEFRRLAHEERRAVVCVTHDMEVAAAADRRVHMVDGRIEGED